MEIYTPTSLETKRKKIAAATASVALFGLLTGCTDLAETATPRRTPMTAEYSADVSPPYYQDIKSMTRFTRDPAVLAELDELAKTPIAEWLYADNKDVQVALQASLDKSKQAGTVPMFVAYNIPNRDINLGSRGGAKNAEAYQDWITNVSETIKDQSAIVILEPDALSHSTEMKEKQAEARIDMLATALDTFYDNNPNTAVYLDAGHSAWHDPRTIAALLKKVEEKTQNGIHGIALNVSNYRPEQEARDFAKSIENEFGRELHVMIDNSRNGAKKAIAPKEWCNPAGQKLGKIDTTYDSSAKVEVAFIKAPGQSDDNCGISHAAAGEFDGDLLFRQIKGK